MSKIAIFRYPSYV